MKRLLGSVLLCVALGPWANAQAFDKWKPDNGERVILRMGTQQIQLIEDQFTPLTKPIKFICRSPAGCTVTLKANIVIPEGNTLSCSYVDDAPAVPTCQQPMTDVYPDFLEQMAMVTQGEHTIQTKIYRYEGTQNGYVSQWEAEYAIFERKSKTIN